MSRKSIPPKIQAEVLHSSRRRCPLCFSYDFDDGVKHGQIAHIDQNSANNARENLVFLCLKHHDEYDSSTSQSKGITKEELVKCNAELIDFLSQSTLKPRAVFNSEQDSEADRPVRTTAKESVSPEVYKIRIPISAVS